MVKQVYLDNNLKKRIHNTPKYTSNEAVQQHNSLSYLCFRDCLCCSQTQISEPEQVHKEKFPHR